MHVSCNQSAPHPDGVLSRAGRAPPHEISPPAPSHSPPVSLLLVLLPPPSPSCPAPPAGNRSYVMSSRTKRGGPKEGSPAKKPRQQRVAAAAAASSSSSAPSPSSTRSVLRPQGFLLACPGTALVLDPSVSARHAVLATQRNRAQAADPHLPAPAARAYINHHKSPGPAPPLPPLVVRRPPRAAPNRTNGKLPLSSESWSEPIAMRLQRKRKPRRTSKSTFSTSLFASATTGRRSSSRAAASSRLSHPQTSLRAM